MYCANCGVKLADTEKRCPLCGTEAYHPEIKRPEVDPLFPDDVVFKKEISKTTAHIIILTLFLIPIFITLYCDYYINQLITWSPYVAISVLLLYVVAILPLWFKKRSPAVFVPIDFAVAALLLLYINHATDGNWFLTLALPLVVYLGVIVTAFTALLYYLKKGHLYAVGGFFIALGLFMDFIELMLVVTFNVGFDGWSLYPMIPLVLIGIGMISISISRSARAVLARKLHF